MNRYKQKIRTPECTKIAHRNSLAIFTADEGIAGNSATRIIFTRFHRRTNRSSLAIFFASEIAHLGASKSRATFWGAGKNRRRNRRESRDFVALSRTPTAQTIQKLRFWHQLSKCLISQTLLAIFCHPWTDFRHHKMRSSSSKFLIQRLGRFLSLSCKTSPFLVSISLEIQF